MKKYRKEFEYSYALGMTVTFELLLSSFDVREVYIHPDVTRNENYSRLMGLCAKRNVPVTESVKAFNILSPKENCFAIGVFIKRSGHLPETSSHIVLASPMNAGNVGTVARTALGLGYDSLALIEPCTDVYAPETVRASMGAVFRLNVEVFQSIDEYIARFPSHRLYPFMLTASLPIESVKFSEPFSLVFGNEAHGLDESYSELGQSVIIPCTDKVDSLNLSIAAAIGMYEAKRKTRQV